MNSISEKLQKLPFKTVAFGAFAALFISTAALLVAPISDTAHAGGAVGGGAGSGGQTGGAQSRYGWGWYDYDVNSAGPKGFRDSQNWADVSQTCRNVGSDRVIAFVVETVNGSRDPGQAVVYLYTPVWDPLRGQQAPGGGWITIAQARAYFDSLSPSDRAGYTWGSNVAWFCYDTSSTWSVSGGSRIQKGATNEGASVYGNITAAPGDRLNWYHHLYNNGPETMDRQVYYNVGKSGFQYGWDGTIDPQGWSSGAPGSYFVTQYATGGASYTLYDVTQNDVGNTLCQGIRWSDLAWNDPTDGAATPACAAVPYNFTLRPEITNITNGQMVESAAGAVPVQGRVTNTGPTKSVPNIQWQVTQVKYRPGTTLPNSGGGTSPSAPCSYFAAPGAQCTPISSGTEAAGYGHNATAAYPATGNLADEDVGTRLCYVMSVKQASSATLDWGHSGLYCLVVGKKPKLQVYGGDVIVGRGYTLTGAKVISGVTTSSSNKGGTYYGSWGEYAIIPSGQILGMASASGYAAGTASNNLCNTTNPLNLLSFSNAHQTGMAPPVCTAGNIGNYSVTAASQYDAIAARFAAPTGATVLTGNVNVASLSAKTIYSGTGTINLSSTPTAAVSPMPAGKWVIINAPNATVRITSDLTYVDGALTSAGDIPQLVIIARNIIIADGVGRVDAWLFAKGTGTDGTIATCESAMANPSILTSTVCSAQLIINGPVISNHLLLHRTHGSDTGSDSGKPAEIFNLRPDAYMWATSFSGVGTKARTVITTELPPRF